MARLRSLEISAINLTVQPPDPQNYIRIWQALFDLKLPVEHRGEQRLLLGKIANVTPKQPLDGFQGFIYRYTHIDTKKPWFDLNKGEEADKDTVNKTVNIPPHLCPNLVTFAYVFYPRSHRLVFESRSTYGTLSAQSVENFIQVLLSQKNIIAEFPNAEATMEQDRQAIDEILDRKLLMSLTITVKKPNPDGPDAETQKAVFDEMDKEGVQRKTLALKAPRGGTITPSEKTRKLAKVASSNGAVEAIAKVDGHKKELSSKNKALSRRSSYNPKKITLLDQFMNVASSFAAIVAGDTHRGVEKLHKPGSSGNTKKPRGKTSR